MKTFFRFARSAIFGAAVILYSVSQLQAVTVYTLNPGGFVTALTSPYPTGGITLASVSSPFSSGVLTGTLLSRAISGDPSNPYGGLTFTYLLSLSAASTQPASQISVSSFGSFLTDVSYNTNAPGVFPSNFSRSSDGAVVRFSFFSPNVLPGQTTALLVVQTDAVNYSPTLAGIIDGTTVNVNALAPIAVPEPATCALMGLVLGILTVLRRRPRR